MGVWLPWEPWKLAVSLEDTLLSVWNMRLPNQHIMCRAPPPSSFAWLLSWCQREKLVDRQVDFSPQTEVPETVFCSPKSSAGTLHFSPGFMSRWLCVWPLVIGQLTMWFEIPHEPCAGCANNREAVFPGADWPLQFSCPQGLSFNH